MERREAPGRCATAPLWGAGALRRTPQRALQGQVCETHPEARARGDLGRAKPCHRTAAPPGAPPRRRACGRITSRVVGGPASASSPARYDGIGLAGKSKRTYHRLSIRSIRTLSMTLMGTEHAACRLSGKTGDAP